MGTRARGGPRQPPNPHPIYRLTDGVRSTRPVQHSAKSVARCFTVAGRPHPTPTKRYETACFRTAPWSPARGTFRDKCRDRKRVVWGKSVSVRVDLGGRRIIEKKTDKETIQET